MEGVGDGADIGSILWSRKSTGFKIRKAWGLLILIIPLNVNVDKLFELSLSLSFFYLENTIYLIRL